MNRVFRNIRQNSVSKHRLRNYILYAIGEIILVVIGIIIALQLNNWNDERKEAFEARKLLQNLQEELAQDSIRINQMLVFEKELLGSSEQLFRAHSGEDVSKEYDTLLGRSFRYAIFTPRQEYSDEIFKELTAKNFFDHFQHRNLKDSIRNYYSQMVFMNQYTLGTDQFTTDLGESLANYYQIRPQDKTLINTSISGAGEENFISEYDLDGFRANKSLNPRLYDMVDIHKDRLGGLINMQNMNKWILKMIKQELKEG